MTIYIEPFGVEPNPDNVASLNPVHEELERAMRWADMLIAEATLEHQLNEVIDTTRVVPTIQSKGRRTRCLAWFSDPKEGHPYGWESREGEILQEMAFCAEDLNRSGPEIVATVLHEKVHKWCRALEIKDCSSSGWHNKTFKKHAEYLGLDVQKPKDAYGFGYTSPSQGLSIRIEKEFEPDIAKLMFHRTVRPPGSRVSTERKWVCSDTCATVYTRARYKPFGGRCHVCGQIYTEI